MGRISVCIIVLSILLIAHSTTLAGIHEQANVIGFYDFETPEPERMHAPIEIRHPSHMHLHLEGKHPPVMFNFLETDWVGEESIPAAEIVQDPERGNVLYLRSSGNYRDPRRIELTANFTIAVWHKQGPDHSMIKYEITGYENGKKKRIAIYPYLHWCDVNYVALLKLHFDERVTYDGYWEGLTYFLSGKRQDFIWALCGEQWQHMAYTIDGDQHTFYVNGEILSSRRIRKSEPYWMHQQTDDESRPYIEPDYEGVLIGTSTRIGESLPLNQHYYVDDVGFFSRAFSDEEIKTLYENGFPLSVNSENKLSTTWAELKKGTR